MEQKRALVLYSGGQDSTTCLFWAIREYGKENVAALGFFYGQRHKSELDSAKSICTEQNIFYDIINMPELGEITHNALTNNNIKVDAADYNGKYPNTFVDGRNHIFLSYAAIYAKRLNICDIVTGVSQADFSGYPDCRDIFIKSLNVTLNLAMDYDFNIITPLMRKDKAEVWALADELGCLDIIKYKTLTCYEGINGEGCGKCPACELRRLGYEKYTKMKG